MNYVFVYPFFGGFSSLDKNVPVGIVMRTKENNPSTPENNKKPSVNRNRNNQVVIDKDSIVKCLSYLCSVWDTDMCTTFDRLESIYSASPGAFLNICMTSIARVLDMNYKNHISDNKEIYVFNTINSKIVALPCDQIKKAAYRYFAAFRSKEEAIYAIRVVEAIKKQIFASINEQK